MVFFWLNLYDNFKLFRITVGFFVARSEVSGLTRFTNEVWCVCQDEGVRLRKVQRGEHITSNSSSALGLESRAGSLPSLLVVIAAIFLGFFLGKFIL